MIYEIKDVAKVKHMFEGWNNILDAVDVEIRIFVTNPDAPRSALVYSSADGIFLAGEPDKELVEYSQIVDEAMFPQNEAWEKLIRECYPEAESTTRYAIHRCKEFDLEKLQSFVDALPEGYEIIRIDSEICDLISADDDLEVLMGEFDTKEAFLEKGRGFAVLKDGKVLAGASSYYCYRYGIDVQIFTAPSERPQGARDRRRGKADPVVRRGRARTSMGRGQHDLGTSGGKVGVSVRLRICVLPVQRGAASYDQRSG